MSREFWIPTRPYSVIDAVNRVAAATGSIRYAMAAAGANYNGHAVSVYWNESRGYWLAEFYWGGRQVLGRGDFDSCVKAAADEHDRGALGSVVYVRDRHVSEADAAVCEKLGFAPWSEAIETAHDASWVTPLHREVGEAVRLERSGLGPATSWLVGSSTLEEYRAKREDGLQAFARRRRSPSAPEIV